MIAGLAFLAGLVAGICATLAIACCMASSRASRREERWRPLDDRAPGERGKR